MLTQLPSTYRAVFTLLAVVWGASYLAGMLLGQPNADRSRRLARSAKLIMIGVVLVYGTLWLSLTAGTHVAGFAWLIVLGLAAGAVGDLLLADIFPLRRAELPAMGAFGVGHSLYLAATLGLRAQFGAGESGPVLVAAGLGAVLAAVGWAVLVRHPGGSRTLNTGSLIYGILLFVTAAVGVSFTITTGKMPLLAVGLVLFAISDMMLAQYLIRRKGFPYIRDVVWIIYSSAQVMIAFAIGAALAVAA